MKLSTNKKRLLVTNCIVLAILLVLAILIWPTFAGMFMPFFLAIIFAYLLNPLVRMMERRGMRRGLAVTLVVLGVLILIILAFMSFVPSLVGSIGSMLSNLPSMMGQIGNIAEKIQKLIEQYNAMGLSGYFDLNGTLSKIGMAIGTALQDVSNAILANSGQLMDVVIIPLVMIMLLMGKEIFSEALMYVVPMNARLIVHKMFCDIDQVIGGFIRGQGLMSIIAGIATGIAAAFIGVPYAPVVGVIAGVTTMIPYFGPAVGMIIICVMAILAGFKQMVLMLIAMAVIQVVAGNVLAPALMSGDVGLHPVIIIFSIFFFGACFGGLGMILAVPLMGTLKVIANYIVAAFGSSVEEAPEPGEKTIEEEQLKKELL